MPLYSDINSINPTSKPLLEDFQSVYQSLITLFNTRPGEIIFDPEYGIELDDSLFEVLDEISAFSIYNLITIAVGRFEPRVIINNSLSSVNPIPNENRFEVNLYFSIVGLDSEQNFEFIGSFSSS